MIFPKSRPGETQTASLLKLLHWLLVGIKFLGLILLGWGTLAIYYSNLPWGWLRVALALFFLIFGVWALWYSHSSRIMAIFWVLFLGVLVWFISINT